KEKPVVQKSPVISPDSGKAVPGSVSFVPSVMGLIIAGEVIKDISGCRNTGALIGAHHEQEL
ncbi:MAG: hypothetical protein ILP19_04800, partial [Oscillospiraceae bacterium]|nr:hypothetical protein [Oscillospiraceae bacterium]